MKSWGLPSEPHGKHVQSCLQLFGVAWTSKHPSVDFICIPVASMAGWWLVIPNEDLFHKSEEMADWRGCGWWEMMIWALEIDFIPISAETNMEPEIVPAKNPNVIDPNHLFLGFSSVTFFRVDRWVDVDSGPVDPEMKMAQLTPKWWNLFFFQIPKGSKTDLICFLVGSCSGFFRV